MLIRGEARVRDTATKMALGASRTRLLREALLDAGGIAVLGCALALPFAWLMVEALRRSIALPSDFSLSLGARIDGRVFAAALGAAAMAVLICGLTPQTFVLSRIDTWNSLKSRDWSAKGRARTLLPMAGVALATALTTCGASLWMGLRTAQRVDLGYRTSDISVVTFDPAQQGDDETRGRSFYRELLDRVKALPGVRGVALAQSVPLGMTGAQKQIRTRDEDEISVWSNIISPEYFERMRMPLVAGRAFGEHDGAVAIINQELANRVRIGEKMLVDGKSVEVVGIAKNAKYLRWDEAPRPFLYLPYSDNYVPRMTLHIESDTDVFASVRSLARGVPVSDARSMREYFDNGAMFGVKIALRIAAVVGGGGLLLALAGLSGAVSSTVARRRQEIAIKVALGATQVQVLVAILREGMTIALLGTAAGLILARFWSGLLAGFVPGSGESAWASAFAAALMMFASLIACVVPAMRALKLEPAQVLRDD